MSTMASTGEEDSELSPTSPVEESDALTVQEPEPAPGIDGIPVRCKSYSFRAITVRLTSITRVRRESIYTLIHELLLIDRLPFEQG
jgi:hypothetical protein